MACDGADIFGAIDSTLSFAHANAAQTGRHRVAVRWLAGTVLSEEGAVTVAPPITG